MKEKFKKIFNIALLTAGMALPSTLLAQPKISGSPCVYAGATYQYVINGSWDAGNKLQVCVSGGTLRGAMDKKICSGQINPVNVILVEWDGSSVGKSSLTMSSSKGDATLDVVLARPLLPGSIDSLSRLQVISEKESPSVIKCMPDTGGYCSPVYSYQWQSSDDHVKWQDITAAEQSDLVFNSPLMQTTYFRRKVTETVSGTIGYSDVSTVIVMIPEKAISNKP